MSGLYFMLLYKMIINDKVVDYMRIIGITILSIFNTIVSILLALLMYGLTQLTLGVGNGASDNSALVGYLFIALAIMALLWLGLYQVYKYNRQLWLLLFAAVGIILTVLNFRVIWFVLLMLIYFTGILLIIRDKNFNEKV